MYSYEWFSVVTHFPLYWVIMWLLTEPRRFYLLLFINVESFMASVTYHLCRLSGDSYCVQHILFLQMVDHAAATLVAVATVMYFYPCIELVFDKMWKRDAFLMFLVVLHINYYQLTQNDIYLQITYGVLLVWLTVFVFWQYIRDQYDFSRIHRGWITASILSLIVALGMYIAPASTYYVTHPIWHLFVYFAEYAALKTSEAVTKSSR